MYVLYTIQSILYSIDINRHTYIHTYKTDIQYSIDIQYIKYVEMQTDCYWQTEESKQTRKLSDRQTERMTVRRILIDRQNSSQTFAFVNEKNYFKNLIN